MSETQVPAPAGWYDDGTGHQRWWDGQHWGLYAPMPVVAVAPTRPLRNGAAIAGFIVGWIALLTCWIYIVGAIIALLGIIYSAVGIRYVITKQRTTGAGFASVGLALSVISAIVVIVGLIMMTH